MKLTAESMFNLSLESRRKSHPLELYVFYKDLLTRIKKAALEDRTKLKLNSYECHFLDIYKGIKIRLEEKGFTLINNSNGITKGMTISWENPTIYKKTTHDYPSDFETELKRRIKDVLDNVTNEENYGAHHLSYEIDQIVRRLTGCPIVERSGWDCNDRYYTYEDLGENEEYLEFIRKYNDGEDGPNTYEWYIGIAS